MRGSCHAKSCLLKLDSAGAFRRARLSESAETEAKVVSPRRNWYADFETVGCDVRGNERDKNTGGSKRALITTSRRRAGGEGEKTNSESSSLIVLSHFDVSVAYTIYFYHL